MKIVFQFIFHNITKYQKIIHFSIIYFLKKNSTNKQNILTPKLRG
jgi:hypothetical protein